MSSDLADGWEDEDDLGLDDDDDDELAVEETPPPPLNVMNDTNTEKEKPSVSTTAVGDGWEEDEDYLDDALDEEEEDKIYPTTKSDDDDNKNDLSQQGDWSFEDDDMQLDSALEDSNHNQNEAAPSFSSLPAASPQLEPQTTAPAASAPVVVINSKLQELQQSLQDYLETLPRLLPSLNAVLEAEYNTHHHAVELVSYYQSRPGLYEYTVQTELGRMDYQMVIDHATTITDVQPHHLSQNNVDPLVVRAANQSLLADVLAVLTGPDAVIRPQLFATAVATQCHFLLHTTSVHSECLLRLSLPHSSRDRLDVAQIHVTVDFAPHVPSLQYRLERMKMLIAPQSTVALQETAAYLAPLVEDLHPQPSAPPPSNNGDAVRDAFLLQLSKTQQFVQASHTGMASALKQMDAVANVSQKLDFIKTVLPSTEQIMAAAASSEWHDEPPPQQQQQQQDGSAVAAARAATAVPPPPWRSSSPRSPPPPPPKAQMRNAPPPPPPPPPGDAAARPAPLLGGLLRTGWSRLAKSVTLPDDYRDASMPVPPPPPPPRQEEVFPKLYRQEQAPPPPPPPPVDAQEAVPKLYRRGLPLPQATQQTSDRPPPPPPPPRQEQTQMADSRKSDKMMHLSTESKVLAAVSTRDEWGEDIIMDEGGWNDDGLDELDDLEVEQQGEATDEKGPTLPRATEMPVHSTPPPGPPPVVVPFASSTQVPATIPTNESLSSKQQPLPLYAPEDDICETRKRWVNPLPGPRRLRIS